MGNTENPDAATVCRECPNLFRTAVGLDPESSDDVSKEHLGSQWDTLLLDSRFRALLSGIFGQACGCRYFNGLFIPNCRHSGVGRNPVTPCAIWQYQCFLQRRHWIPAYAGMTVLCEVMKCGNWSRFLQKMPKIQILQRVAGDAGIYSGQQCAFAGMTGAFLD